DKPPTLEQTAKDLKALKEAQDENFKKVMEQFKSLNDQLKSLPELRKDVDLLKDNVRSLNSTQELAIQAARAKSAELEEALKQLRADLEKSRAQAGRTEEQVRNLTATCDGLTDKLTQARKQLAETSRQAARMTDAT